MAGCSALPGLVISDNEADLPSESLSGTLDIDFPVQPLSSARSSDRIPGLYADVWEYSCSGWEVTHQFNSGLVLERTYRPGTGSGESRVHLPAVSLQALQQLRTCLHSSNKVALDVKSTGKHVLSEVHNRLLDMVWDSMPEAARNELTHMVARRSEKARSGLNTPSAGMQASQQNWETQSIDSSVFVEPEEGREAVDISVCAVPGIAVDATPVVAVARLASLTLVQNALHSVPVRYIVLVICPVGTTQMASKLGEAFATTFMDEDFAGAMRAETQNNLEFVLAAFDRYLTTLTIVPTVHLSNCGRAERETSERLLSDSVVDSIEKFICERRGIKQKSGAECKTHCHRRISISSTISLSNSETVNPPKFFVEVDELYASTDRWRLTHRLQNGLEHDNAADSKRLHLPRVSVGALAILQQLMTPTSVALNVKAESPVEAVNFVLEKLRGGVPEPAMLDLSRALLDRAVGTGIGSVKSLGSEAGTELLIPRDDAEACNILAMTCKGLPRSHKLTGVFVRFSSPLTFSFPSTGPPSRFLLVFTGPMESQAKLATLVDSVAALSTDEDLMAELHGVSSVGEFIDTIDQRLENLVVVPRTRLLPKEKTGGKEGRGGHGGHGAYGAAAHGAAQEPGDETSTLAMFKKKGGKVIRVIQKYSLPLVSGVLLALLWSNVDKNTYHDFNDGSLIGDHTVFTHVFSLHFIVNDIFMCFFFGLAIKEVTEALLPGGSLSPLRRAVNPLMATVGGVVGPAVAYMVYIAVAWYAGAFDGSMCFTPSADGGAGGHRRLGGGGGDAVEGTMEPCELATLLNGWGVPTATDISLAWMFALLIFGAGHPAINFLLLLAIVDDAMGMVIIAVCYPDPTAPVEPLWLLLVLLAMVMAYAMRRLKVPWWSAYVFLCGPVSWLGLLKAHVHPALALVFVVPFIPASHALAVDHEDCADLGAWDPSGRASPRCSGVLPGDPASSGRLERTMSQMSAILQAQFNYKEAPLHVLEHSLKLPVDIGMFFFGLSNAGVSLNTVGHLTGSVLFALIVGKTLGIAGFSLLAVQFGFGLPPGVTKVDLFAMSALGGVGLTVALFVANEAFIDPSLQGQAKFAAVLSVLSAGVAAVIRFALSGKPGEKAVKKDEFGDKGIARSWSDADYIDNLLIDDILQILWVHQRYQARGVTLPLKELAGKA